MRREETQVIGAKFAIFAAGKQLKLGFDTAENVAITLCAILCPPGIRTIAEDSGAKSLQPACTGAIIRIYPVLTTRRC